MSVFAVHFDFGENRKSNAIGVMQKVAISASDPGS
jgi:hypothetical protein